MYKCEKCKSTIVLDTVECIACKLEEKDKRIYKKDKEIVILKRAMEAMAETYIPAEERMCIPDIIAKHIEQAEKL